MKRVLDFILEEMREGDAQIRVDAEHGLERDKVGGRETSQAAAVLIQERDHEGLN